MGLRLGLIDIYKTLRQNWDQQKDQLEKLILQAMAGTADGQTKGQLAPRDTMSLKPLC
jgi:hypothetical protein